MGFVSVGQPERQARKKEYSLPSLCLRPPQGTPWQMKTDLQLAQEKHCLANHMASIRKQNAERRVWS